MPPEFESIADLFRAGAKQLVSGESSSSSFDFSQLSQLFSSALSETESRLIFEIHQNRSLIIAIESALQAQNILAKDSTKTAAINELVNLWLSDLPTHITHIDDIESSVPFPHLRPFTFDALQELSSRKIVTISPGGKIKWTY